MDTTACTTHTTPTPLDQPVRLGDLLVAKGLLTQDQIDEALATQRDDGHQQLLGELLIEQGIVSPECVAEVLAEAYGVPFARVGPKLADPRVIELLPREFLEKQCVLPLFAVRGKLTVAVPEPANVFLIEEIERRTDLSVQIVAATANDIQATLRAHLPNSNLFVIDQIVDDIQATELSIREEEAAPDLADLERAGGDSPVIKLVNYLIASAVQEGASDIHIEPGDGRVRVRFRVDGELYEKIAPPHHMHPAIASRIKIMAGLDISERRLPQDGGISVMLKGRSVDLRVSSMPGKFGEKIVMRVIDGSGGLIQLERLGFGDATRRQWNQIIRQPNGVVLVTGPTGSGKSTTLYASLNAICDDSVNVSTVEDPVEFALHGVNQFQVNEKAGFTFASALRALLRQDPDVIMVGEIRDHETARMVTQAALTGHLVLSTLHTNDAPSAITRLLNIGVEPYLVAASVRGVLAQRLIRRICPNCKESVQPNAQQHRALEQLARSEGICVNTLHRGTGCARCRNSGYSGRIGVYELFVPDDDTLDAISHGASLQELRRLARAGGMTTLVQDGLQKVAAGETTLEELFNISSLV